MIVKELKKILLLLTFAGLFTVAHGQSEKTIWQTLNYSVYIGGSCPIGTSARANITNAVSGVDYLDNNWVLADQGGMKASAKLGFNIGGKASLPFEEVGIKFGNGDAMRCSPLSAKWWMPSSLTASSISPGNPPSFQGPADEGMSSV